MLCELDRWYRGPLALKCDLREDRAVQDRLARYGMHTIQYEEGLTVARRIRASRYLGMNISVSVLSCVDVCSAQNAAQNTTAVSMRYSMRPLECH